jgi:DNA-binding CsgD family transcriptional regulator
MRREIMNDKLTPREQGLLNGLCAGLLNKQIAARIGISEQTVKNELIVLYLKLGVTTRTQAVIKVLEDHRMKRKKKKEEKLVKIETGSDTTTVTIRSSESEQTSTPESISEMQFKGLNGSSPG